MPKSFSTSEPEGKVQVKGLSHDWSVPSTTAEEDTSVLRLDGAAGIGRGERGGRGDCHLGGGLLKARNSWVVAMERPLDR